MRADGGHRGAQTLRPLRDILFAAAKNLLYLHINICGYRQVMLRNAHKLNLQNVIAHRGGHSAGQKTDMFKTKKLTDIYSTYLTANRDPFGNDPLDIFWTSNKKYKADILQMFDDAIADKDIKKLQFCIAVSFRDGLDGDYSERYYKIILDTWHEEHEDIVDNVYNLKDERFCEPLLKIAMDRSTYRKFDTEMESTLRKCVHALKVINSQKSLDALTKLIETKNPNVQYALDQYK